MVILSNGATIEMQWKQIKYTNHKQYIVFQVVPMIGKKDIVLIPNKDSWEKIKNIFSFEEREAIVFLLKEIKWKRELNIVELDITPFENKEIKVVNGMLEATEGYRTLSNENLFDPNSKLDKKQVKSLYCILEKRFASSLRGVVTIPRETIIEGSVMKEITIPSLKENKSVKLKYVPSIRVFQ